MRWLLALPLIFSTPAHGEDGPRVSSGFGARIDPLHGRRATHRGLDMPGRRGTPILAAASGTVRVAGRRGGYGEMVELAHPDGTATRYAHLLRILVVPGEWVAQGQLIAEMGSTGRSTGSHLHFEYRVNGVAVDPRPCFNPNPSPRTCSGVYRAAKARAEGSGEPFAARWIPKQVRGDDHVIHRSRFAKMRAMAPVPTTITLPNAREVSR